MENLTTRKIVLGILMAFVLAFGVHGTVDAQSVSVSGDGSTTSSSSGTTVITDYRTTPDVMRSFTIRVSGAEDGETITVAGLEDVTGTTAATDVSITEVTGANSLINDDGSVGSLPAASVAIIADAPDIGAGRDMNGDNDQLDIVTSFSEATLGVDLNGDGDQTDTLGSIRESVLNADLNGDGDQTDTLSTVYEYTEDPNWTGSATLTVKYTVSAFGVYRVSVTAPDIDTDISGSPIRAYVVRSDTLARNTGIGAGSTTTPMAGIGSVSVTIAPVAEWTRVDLSVSGGKLYLDSGQYLSSNKLFDVNQRKEFTSLSMFTDDAGTVTAQLLQTSGQVAKITAKIPGSNARGKEYVITSFNSAITVNHVSGNKQFGYTNQGSSYISWNRLRDPLVVRVVDGHGTNKGVGGQWVQFTTTGSNARLRAASQALLWDQNGDGFINATDDNLNPSLTVKTDSSGYAKVYLLPGTTAETYTITYAVMNQTSPTALGSALTGAAASSAGIGSINEQFTATAILDTSATRDYEIDRAASTSTPFILRTQGDTMMEVNVNDDGGTDAANVQVEFSVTGGRITLTSGANYKTSLSTVTDTGGDATVWVQANSGSVAIVTARIAGNNEDSGRYVVTFLHDGPYIEYVSGDDQDGAVGGRLEHPLVVRVLDGRGGSAIPNQIVKFEVTADTNDHSTNLRRFDPVPGTYVFVVGTARDTFDDGTTESPAATSLPREATSLRPIPAGGGQNIFIQTDSKGEAKVYLLLGSADDTSTTDAVEQTTDGFVHRVTATTPNGAPSSGVAFRADSVNDARKAKLEIVSGDGQSAGKGDPLADPLVVRVRTVRGYLIPGVLLKFTALDGTLTEDPDHDTVLVSTRGGGNEIRVRTGSDGEARVDYNVGQLGVARDVKVEVVEEVSTAEYDFEIDEVKFRVNGGGTQQQNQQQRTRSGITFSRTTITGEPGTQVPFTVTVYDAGSPVRGTTVTLTGATFSNPSPTTNSGGTASSTVTIPDSSTTITATASGYTARASITVSAVPDELVKVSGDNQEAEPGDALSSAFVVRVEDRNNNPIAGQTVSFSVTAGGGSLSSSSDTTDSSGQASTILTLGDEAGTNTVEASVSGVSSVTFTATGEGGLKELIIVSGDGQEALPNRRLTEPLVVQVVDSNDEGVEGVYVTFTLESGSGRVTTRRSRTDEDGNAEGEFVPSAVGTVEIEASVGELEPVTFTLYVGGGPDAIIKVSGDKQSGAAGKKLAKPFVVEVIDEDDDPLSGITVTFKVVTGDGELSATSSRTGSNGRAQTTLTLGKDSAENVVEARVSGLSDRIVFRASSAAQVLVDAAQRPPIYWVDKRKGTLHSLVDADTEDIASGVVNVLNVAVDAANGYVYWTATKGKNRGTIGRAGLNGGKAETLKTLTAVPIGIAVDSAGGTLYWTNSRGRIQSMPTSGGKIKNVLQNLSSPGAIALSNGVLYWSEATGSVRRMSLTASQKVVTNIATGLGEPLSIAIAKGKIYWVERAAGGGGSLQRANLNGTGIQELKTFAKGMPLAIAIDSSANKIYWTKSAGKIQRTNLVGRFVKDIVTGLDSPGSIALGTETDDEPVVEQPTQRRQQTQQTQTTTETDDSKYDVNGDGSVNNIDLTLVAIALGSDNMQYDVNGDGTVNADDVRAVSDAISDAAAAPAIHVDLKALDIDFDRVQEQIEMLIAAGDLSLEGQRVLMYLQHLLASARPAETLLLANYPNPFNPETWIPYHLATGTDVRINIYNAQGILVRALTLGHQTAGYYTSRSRAAYWDGRNALGERVASGIYFYQLQTDEISPMRKMVILK